MPEVEIVFYKDDLGKVPIDDWLDTTPRKARAKCLVAMKRLKSLGHELRRPEADYIGDGLYELRTAYLGVNYRIIYFFHGTQVIVLAQGLVKERALPEADIARARRFKKRFEEEPAAHTAKWELSRWKTAT